MKAEAWVYAGRDIKDYLFAEPDLYDYPKDRRKIFAECARPHFKFFWKRAEHKIEEAELDVLRRQVDNIIKSGAKIVFLTREGWAKKLPIPKADYPVVQINDADIFGNVEPVWRKIRLKFNNFKFDAVLVNLGLERGIIIPRLVQVYNVPAYDVSPFAGAGEKGVLSPWQSFKRWFTASYFIKIIPYLDLLRPYNWFKNLLIFAPLFFAREIFDIARLVDTLWAFAAFSVIAGGVYAVNDLVDINADRNHSFKNQRPLASGSVSRKAAVSLAAALFILGSFLVYAKAAGAAVLFVAYVILNFLYSLWLKHIPIVDMLTVSSFYLIRVFTGAAAADVPLSPWLMLCTIFIALFIITGKRYAELQEIYPRAVMRFYTEKLLDAFLIITVSLALVIYGLYTILVINSDIGIYATFFVILGLFRYLQLIYEKGGAASPEKIFLGDYLIRFSVVFWLILMYLVFYVV